MYTNSIAAISYFLLPKLLDFCVDQIPISIEEEFGENASQIILKDEEELKPLSILLDSFAQEIDFNTEYNLSFHCITSPTIRLPFRRENICLYRFTRAINSPKACSSLTST